MDAHVFWAWDRAALTDLASLCTTDDCRRAAANATTTGLSLRLASYGLLRFALIQHYPAAGESIVSRHSSGQPYLPDWPDISVSLSHTSIGVAVAVSQRSKVGVDIEADQDPSTWHDVGKFITPDTHHDAQSLLRLWTASEACAKSHGLGLPAVAAVHVPFDPSDNRTQTVTWNGLAQRDVSVRAIQSGALAYAVSAGAAVTVTDLRESMIKCSTPAITAVTTPDNAMAHKSPDNPQTSGSSKISGTIT